MPLIEWEEDMAVGLDLLDDDHKVLIQIINAIDAAPADSEQRTDIVRKALADLDKFATYHFDREEKVMEASGYIERKNHRVAHQAFLRDLAAMTQRFEREPSDKAISQLKSYLNNWLIHHIMVQDRAYRAVIENDPAAEAAARSVAPLVYEPA